MKKFIYIILLMAAGVLIFTKCSDDPEAPVLTEYDYPRIMGFLMDIEERPVQTQMGHPWEAELQYTPVEYCTAIWYVDGVEYARGASISYTPTSIGTVSILFEVSTPHHSTHRKYILTVVE
ncbi:hypothetical protein [uncultured Dysgonomonas sp.]|uniref:DUF4377 domain-containing protein n=1 Tax=uncultured Dysgonomonas sp. TaxID=206096 RepID=A0A212JDJ5_9BACT|nr:hypothetical protein [uncultured Dysgonomonas sp.]SBV97510.1 conserved hypothetical protein [uncultured Dysgonomonas sp.]